MKINNIPANTAFGRVVKVNSISNPARKRVPVDSSTFEISKVLNGQGSDKYALNDRKRIRKLFERTLGDYHSGDKVLMRKIGKDAYIASGEDALQYRDYIKRQGKKAEKLSQKQRDNFIAKSYINADRRLLENVENGLNGKPESVFEFSVRGFYPEDRTTEEFLGLEPIDVRFDKIIYKTDKPYNNDDLRRSANRYLEISI